MTVADPGEKPCAFCKRPFVGGRHRLFCSRACQEGVRAAIPRLTAGAPRAEVRAYYNSLPAEDAAAREGPPDPDALTANVYADWLEDNGEPAAAAKLRAAFPLDDGRRNVPYEVPRN
jgi:uncharacterized protein (TIGR02996 family)